MLTDGARWRLLLCLIAAFALPVSALAACSHATSSPAPASPAPLPIATGDFPPFGHAPDFSWVSGRIERSIEGGDCTYVLFSSHPGAPWGGRLALVAKPEVLDAFRTGDFVVVLGDFDPVAEGNCGMAYRAVLVQEH